MKKNSKPKLPKLSVVRRLTRDKAKRVFADALREWVVRRADRQAETLTSHEGWSSLLIAAAEEADVQSELFRKAWAMFGQQVTREETVELVRAVYQQISPEVRGALTLPEPNLLIAWLWDAEIARNKAA